MGIDFRGIEMGQNGAEKASVIVVLDDDNRHFLHDVEWRRDERGPGQGTVLGDDEADYTPRWTEKVVTVSAVQYTDPPTYKIADLNDEAIPGTFYEQELQKTSQEIFRIEKVIRKRGDKSIVKWLGYPDSFNSWVDNKDITRKFSKADKPAR